jgi:hypothetical protein
MMQTNTNKTNREQLISVLDDLELLADSMRTVVKNAELGFSPSAEAWALHESHKVRTSMSDLWEALDTDAGYRVKHTALASRPL